MTVYRLTTLITLCLLGSIAYAQPKLKKVWETDELPVPESVLLDQKTNTLYVSLIGEGDAAALDGNGGIAKLDLNGKIIQKDWAKGLNSPKGLGLFQDKLYVADLKELVIINTKNGKIIQRLPFPEAGMLNDVTVDAQGNVFVSDSKGGTIYQVAQGKAHVFLAHLVNPNGVLADGSDLYFLDSGTLYKANQTQQVSKIAEGMEKSTDGLQHYGNDFLVSCWAGVLYHVPKDGAVHMLLDTRKEKINTADFTFDNQSHMLYLPTFFKNCVIAYKIE
ncbi:ATP/GTP-binding protein [Olivibacter ginsenosidimutans]|uniref:ATP/GTP-binding protein n=1 Tax=Olivibacter ginsenosidimutans TaxID=1176537 RepID=A0ABP9AF29_9SPHI